MGRKKHYNQLNHLAKPCFLLCESALFGLQERPFSESKTGFSGRRKGIFATCWPSSRCATRTKICHKKRHEDKDRKYIYITLSAERPEGSIANEPEKSHAGQATAMPWKSYKIEGHRSPGHDDDARSEIHFSGYICLIAWNLVILHEFRTEI